MSVNDYEYDKELTSSSLSSTSEQGRVPRPPQIARTGSSNLYSRQRIYKTYSESNTNSFERDAVEVPNIHPNDSIIKMLNATPPSSGRLTKYAALPKISDKSGRDSYSPTGRPASISSNYEFDYNDLYDDNDDASILIGLRLPDGTKKQKTFSANTKLRTILKFGLDETEVVESYSNLSMFTLLQLPNNVIEDLDQTIKEAKIQNRSMLFIIDKQHC